MPKSKTETLAGSVAETPTGQRVLQFKIVLKDTRPQIWRRIQVLDSGTFWALHVAIQDSMGWLDSHLHEFFIPDIQTPNSVSVGMPDMYGYNNVLPGWDVPITRFFRNVGDRATYVYDFGDDWIHSVVVEKVLPVNPAITYPICVGGKRACPPEDCGGPWGYKSLLKALADADHPEHDNVVEWLEEDFDPADFSPEYVYFDDPDERKRNSLRNQE